MLILQISCGLCWCGPMAMTFQSLLRLWRGKGNHADVLESALFFIAFVQSGYSVRWIIWHGVLAQMQPEELWTWAGLYALSAFGALFLTASLYSGGARRG